MELRIKSLFKKKLVDLYLYERYKKYGGMDGTNFMENLFLHGR